VTAPDPSLAAEDYCYLTTTGRVSGKPHAVEIWFGLENGVLYMLSGSGTDQESMRPRADWVRNILRRPSVQVRIKETTYSGRGRLVSDSIEDATARRLLVQKYTPRHNGELNSWGRSSLPVAVDFE
jgi:nitroimidazol reductase NimA-like FMN-containing flavoprotein (pyridoxamine 5'-phosphate oxidase superfamily)